MAIGPACWDAAQYKGKVFTNRYFSDTLVIWAKNRKSSTERESLPPPARRHSRILSRARRLKQEPDATLRLVDPDFQQTCRSHVARFVAQIVRFAHSRNESLVVFPQLAQHVHRIYIIRVIVLRTLQAADMPDRPNRGTTDFANTLRDIVADRENLVSVLIE